MSQGVQTRLKKRLKGAVREEHQEFETIRAAKHMIDKDWHLHFIHVNRESNQAADFLAKLGLASQAEYQRISQVSSELLQILRLDSCNCSNYVGD